MSYTPKTESQKAWDLIKAGVTAKINLEVAAYRIERRDELLSELWPQFSAALSGEDIYTLDPETMTWISDALAQISETSSVR